MRSINNEQINDVVDALHTSTPVMPPELLSRCKIINTYTVLAPVVDELTRRGYLESSWLGIKLNEKIGACDGCGRVAHHLLGGECEQCRQQSAWANTPVSQPQPAGAHQ